jgi:metallo-beta-lactamase family protein
MGIKKI